VLTIPSVEPTTSNPNRPKRDSSAKCLTPPDQPIPSTSKEPIPVRFKKRTKIKKASKNYDWECGVCKKNYKRDEKKNGSSDPTV